MKQEITTVDFYSLDNFNGLSFPAVKTIRTPINLISSVRGLGVSDAEIELSKEQFSRVAPGIFDFFAVEGTKLLFVITEIRQKQENGHSTFTLVASEILSWYMSRRTSTIDRIPANGTTFVDYVKLLLSQLVPVAVSTTDIYASDEKILMHVNVLNTAGINLEKYLHDNETMMAWLLRSLEGTNKYLKITSGINTTYNGTDRAVFVEASFEILEWKSTGAIKISADITQKEREIADVIYQQSFQHWGPVGGFFPEDRDSEGVVSKYYETQSVMYTNQTQMYGGRLSKGKYLTALTDSVRNVSSKNGLESMTYESFEKYLSDAVQAPDDFSIENKIQTVTRKTPVPSGTQDYTFVQLELQELSIAPTTGMHDDALNFHRGIRVYCTSLNTLARIREFYKNLGHGCVVLDRYVYYTERWGVMTYSMDMYRNVNGQDVNFPLGIINMTREGGVPVYTGIQISDYRIYDATKTLSYLFPLAMAAFEIKMAVERRNRLTSNITANTAHKDLNLGDVVWVDDGIDGRKGFVSSVTETRENGTYSKDYEIEWQ